MTVSPSKRLVEQFSQKEIDPDKKFTVKGVQALFRGMAEDIDVYIPDGPDKTVALRQLLEAKDTAVRAVIFAEPNA